MPRTLPTPPRAPDAAHAALRRRYNELSHRHRRINQRGLLPPSAPRQQNVL